uniref:Spexin hormone n=1 Tax=Amazona collaria TaxID=241587 RepID=A0A8B9GK30_9PSIT
AQGLRKLTAIATALFLAASLVSFSWSAPQTYFQRRNWTPQAMLYLKGAQGRRFISDESQQNNLYDRMKLGKYMCTGTCSTLISPQIMGEICGNWKGYIQINN